jgi:tetratricopeptide (TPR) repeat protein
VGYHLLRIMVHVLNAALIYMVAAAFLRHKKVEAYSRYALVAAVLFAVHPVQTEPVNWVSSLSDILYTFFFLLAFIFYSSFTKRYWGIAISLTFFSLSLLTKETAAVFLLFLLAHYYAFNRRSEKISAFARRYMPYILVAGVYLALRTYVIGGVLPTKRIGEFSAVENAMNAVSLFANYVKKLLFPVDLNVYHVFNPARAITEISWIMSFFVFLLYMLALYMSKRKARDVFFLLLWIALPLLPVLYAPAVGENIFAERYLYLSVAGLTMLLSLGLERLDRLKPHGKVFFTVFMAIAVIYALGTLKRGQAWKDDLSLWTDTVRKSPAAHVPRNNLGVALEEKGLYEEAVNEYKTAIDIAPDYARAHQNLGLVYRKQGRYDEALRELQTALKLKPDYARAHYNIGIVYIKQGLFAEAVEELNTALKIDPGLVEAHNRIGVVYYTDKKYDDAVKKFEDALNIDPDNAKAHYGLGRVHEKRGRYEDAENEYVTALAMAENAVEVRDTLGSLYSRQGRYKEAQGEFLAILKIDPEHKRAHYKLGIIYLNWNSYDEAAYEFQAALSIDRNYALAHNGLGLVYEKLGNLEIAVEKFGIAARIDPETEIFKQNLRRVSGLME